MSNILHSGYTLLNDELDLPEVTEEVVVVDEATEIEAELEELEIAISVTEDQIEQAEELVSEVQETLESGGLTAREAVFVHRALAGLHAMNRQKVQYFSTESFSAAGGRQTYTMEAVDRVKATVKAWWEKLKAFFKKWMDKAYDFYSAHISSAGRLEKAFLALRDRATDSKATDKKEAKLKLGKAPLERLFVTDASDIEAANIARNLNAAKTQLDKGVNATKAVIDSTKEALRKIDGETVFDANGVSNVAELIADVTGGNRSTADFTGEDGVISDKAIFGGDKLGARGTVTGTGKEAKLTSVSVRVEAGKPSFKDDEEVEALSIAQIKDICSAGRGVCGAIRQRNKDMSSLKDMTKVVISEGEKAAKRLENSKDDAAASAGRAAINGQLAAGRVAVDLNRRLVSATLKAAQAAYTYSARSFSNLKENK